MPIQLTAGALKEIFPRAPQAVIDAFASAGGQRQLFSAGITDNAKRMAVAFAHCHHETSGFSIPNLTENINYTAERAAEVWPINSKAPERTFRSVADVYTKTGSFPKDPKFKFKLMNLVYGNRMGNRPGTSDGSAFIGRGGPQITGRDGYAEVGKRIGLPLEAQPELACRPEHQPAILAAFWSWKGLNGPADAGGIDATVRPWNGGTNGLADRKAQYARILPIVQRLTAVADPPDVAPKPAPAPPAAPPVDPATPVPRGRSLIEGIAKFVSAIIAAFKGK